MKAEFDTSIKFKKHKRFAAFFPFAYRSVLNLLSLTKLITGSIDDILIIRIWCLRSNAGFTNNWEFFGLRAHDASNQTKVLDLVCLIAAS
jgi:hypothetical protein